MVASLQGLCIPFYGMLTVEVCIYSKDADGKSKNEIHGRCFSNLYLRMLCDVTFDLAF